MFRFNRERILPLFLQKRWTVAELARRAGIAQSSAQRAVNGNSVAAPIIAKVADALGIGNVVEFLEGGKKMFSKKTIRITRDDGTTKDVELSISEGEKGLSFAYWGEDDSDAQKAFAQYCAEYFSQKQKAAV